MSDKNYKEVLIVLVACIALFLVLAGIILLFLVLYQKRKFSQQRQLLEMQNKYKEQILQSQIEIQEITFNNISQEIHDNVGQILSLAKIQINIMNESETMSKSMLNEVKENLSKAMVDLRDIAKSLSTDRAKSLSVFAATRYEAERITRSNVCQIEVTKQGEEKTMNDQKKLILYRIIQECLQNSIKHANGPSIAVDFFYKENEVEVITTDTGKGFNPALTLESNSGLGLLNIRSRAMLAGGHCNIESKLNEGTTVTISMPYE